MNAKAIATLGIGFGPKLVAQIGLGPVGAPPEVPSGFAWAPSFKPRRRPRYQDDEDVIAAMTVLH